MISDAAFTWSDRCFRALLSLYPAEFRVRFGREMAQIFRDCCRDEARAGGHGQRRGIQKGDSKMGVCVQNSSVVRGARVL